MVYKKFIEKNGKTYGPYLYSSRRVNGKVVSEYKGHNTNSKKVFLFSLIAVLSIAFLFCILHFSPRQNFSEQDLGANSVPEVSGFARFSSETFDKISSTGLVVYNSAKNSIVKIIGFVSENSEENQEAREEKAEEKEEDKVEEKEEKKSEETSETTTTSTEETSSEEITPAEETSETTTETPTEIPSETPIEETPVEETPAETPAEDGVLLEKEPTMVEKPTTELPTEENPVEETPMENITEIPAEENETASENTTTEQTNISETSEVIVNQTEEITEPEINITETNQTIPEISNETISNFSLANETLFNETIQEIQNETASENATILISTKQYKSKINSPVKWIKFVEAENLSSENIEIKIPKKAENVSIKTGEEAKTAFEEAENSEFDSKKKENSVITGFVIGENGKLGKFFSWFRHLFITGKIISEEEVLQTENLTSEDEDEKIVDISGVVQDENAVAVEYYTEAPQSFETEKANGKTIVISGPDELNYTDILAYTEISENLKIKDKNKIKLYWVKKEFVNTENIENLSYEKSNIAVMSRDEKVASMVSSILSQEINYSNNNNYLNFSINNNSAEGAPVASMVRHSPDKRGLVSRLPGSIPGWSASAILTGDAVSENNYRLVKEEVAFEVYDLDGNSLIDYVEWIVPHLSNQTYELILVTKAEHLDENRTFIKDIYNEVKELDDNWTEPVYSGEYVRVTFEKNLSSINDITIYARGSKQNTFLQVYYFNSSEIISNFSEISDAGYYSINLTGMIGSSDTFDLKVVNEKEQEKKKDKYSAYVEFDYIVDPATTFSSPSVSDGFRQTGSSVEINVSVYDNVGLKNFIYNWNGTNYTIYDDSLKLMMNFDSYTQLNDTSRYGNNGSCTSCPILNETGKWNGGVYFDGTSNFVNIGNQSSLKGMTQFSISSWINSAGATSTYQSIFSSSLNEDNYFRTALNTSGAFVAYMKESTLIDCRISSMQSLFGGWHHVILTFNGSTCKTYLDGIDWGWGVANYSLTIGMMPNTNRTDIGAYPSIYTGVRSQFFNGSIDEVRIWNRSLSATEIYENYVSNLQKYNSTDWKFYINQSQNATTGLGFGTYNYQAMASDTSNNWNYTDVRTLYIQSEVLAPGINFTKPTQANNTQTLNTSVLINVSIAESNLSSLIYNWNGTNYTIYNDSLVLMMNFDSYTQLNDTSRYGNNGTFGGGAFLNESGKWNGGAQFDGIDDYVNIGDSDNLEGQKEISFSAWVNPVNLSSYKSILSKNDNNAEKRQYFIYFYDVGVPLRIFSRVCGALDGSDCVRMDTNVEAYSFLRQWSFITYTYSNTAGAKLYLNGNQINSTSSVLSSGSIVTSDNPLIIGGSLSTGTINSFFNGSIDEVRIWNRSLSASEIYENYVSNLQKYNSTDWKFYINQSYNSTTGLGTGVYNYQSCAEDTSSNMNCTEIRSLTIGEEIISLNTSRYFIATWDTRFNSTGSSNASQIILPLASDGTYNFEVNWGDGNSNNITAWNDVTKNHSYALGGAYNITINGTFTGFNFSNYGDRLKLVNITQWGNLKLGNTGGYFYGASNLNITAEDTLDLTGTNTMQNAFYNCRNLTLVPNINSWNLSQVVSFNSMFRGATNFNQNLSNWDTHNITSTINMFYGASAFNQSLENWNTSKVTTMSTMFYSASAFNQNLSNWDTSKVTTMTTMFFGASAFNQNINSWNTSKVTDISFMFQGATSFNQPLENWDVSKVTTTANMFKTATSFNQNISLWDVSKVTTMTSMFEGASLFNRDLNLWNVSAVTTSGFNSMFLGASSFNGNVSGWIIKSTVTSFDSMFSGASNFNQPVGTWNVSMIKNMNNMFYLVNLSTDNYDDLLISWASLPDLNDTILFGAGNSTYCLGENARNSTLIGVYGWKINDGGKNASCVDVYPTFSNYWDDNGSLIGNGLAHFNVTLLNTNGSVWLEINNSNTTATSFSANVYNATINFTNTGNYSYQWWAYGNGSSKLLNGSVVRNYHVNDSTSASDTILPNVNFTFPTPANATQQNFSTIYVNVTSSDVDNNISTFIDFDNSLVGWWRMDDANSTTVFDYDGENNATISGFSQVITGKIGEALEFNGVNESVTTSNNFDFEHTYSVSGWIKPYTSSGNQFYFGVAGGGFIGKTGNTFWIRYANTSGSNKDIMINNYFVKDQWTYLTLYFSITGNSTNFTLYKDGIFSYSEANNEGVNNVYGVFNLGNWQSGQPYWFNGSIDDVMIFNRSLSATEISALYANTSSKYLEVNYTGLSVGNHTFKAYAQDLAGNVNATEKFVVETFASDLEYPIFSNPINTIANGSLYSPSLRYEFNISVLSSNTSVKLEFNGANYTATDVKTNRIYNVTLPMTLGAGNYTYQWNAFGNGTLHLYNVSNIYDYSVLINNSQLITPLLNSANANLSVVYPQQINATYSGTNFTTLSLTYNGTSLNFWTNYTIGVGYWTLNYSYVSDSNYSAFSDILFLNVTGVGGACDVLFNATSPLNYLEKFKVYTNCDSASSLYRNGTAVSNNSQQNLGAGTYNFSVLRTDRQNYSAIADEEYFTINPISSSINLTLNNTQFNITIEQSSIISLNCSLISGDATSRILLYNNKTLINNGTTKIGNNTNFTNLALMNITCIYEATQNYSSSSESWWVNAIDSNAPTVSVTYPANTSYNTNISDLNYTFIDANPDNCWYSRNLGITNSTLPSAIQNFSLVTSTEGSNTWTVYCNDTSGNKGSNSITFFKDTVAPIITSYTLANKTYNNRTILINFTADSYYNFWFYNGTGNTSYSAPTYITAPENSSTFMLCANDSLGNINCTSITFYARNNLDNDSLLDESDYLLFNETFLRKSGLANLDIFVNGSTNVDADGWNGTYTFEFYNNTELILNFTHNLTQSPLDLSKITIALTANSILVNTSGQLLAGENKTIYLSDNSFVSLCVKDAPISTIDEISTACNLANETNFNSCLGVSAPVVINNITCYDEGTRIRIQNLSYSGARGTGATPITPTTTGVTTSSGGGSAAPKEISYLEITPKVYNLDMTINRNDTGVVNLVNKGKSIYTAEALVSSSLKDIIKLEQDSVSIEAGQAGELIFKINSPKEPGVYTGKITISSGGNIEEVLISLNVNSEKNLFDISVFIPDKYKQLSSGENLFSQISLIQAGLQEKEDVTINYFIRDFDGKTLFKESETMMVHRDKSFSKEFFTQDLPEGNYLLGIEVVYSQGVATSSAQFKIGQVGEKENYWTYLAFACAAAVFCIMVGLIARYKKSPNLKQ